MFLLDAAKIIDECQKHDVKNEDLQNKKMALIRRALVNEPMNGDLWVHFHLFSSDPHVRQQAIFKAYELSPDNTFV
jgi:hypothetical protein